MPNARSGHDDAERSEPVRQPDGHDHAHRAHHGHANDQGISGALRYLRWLPQMWRSAVNDAVVGLVDPKPGERVVDIGAGMGAGALPAAAAGAHVIAVEPTPFMRGVLNVRRMFSRHRAGVDVVDGAAERIPVADRTIDAIWAVNTMHHWVDVEHGVAEIARVLRPTGRILLVDEVFTDPSHPDHERFGTDPEHHGFTMIDADEMGGLLRAAGLTDVDATVGRIADRPVIRIVANGAARDAG
jgi:SAM-dependent methyltransferase